MSVLIGAEVLDALVVSASIARRTFKLDQINQPYYHICHLQVSGLCIPVRVLSLHSNFHLRP